MGRERELLHLQQELMPDLLERMHLRYEILRYIHWKQPLGRRGLAQAMGMTERTLRAEVEYLRDLGLLYMQTSGMVLAEKGNNLIAELEPMMKVISGRSELEEQLRFALRLKHVVIVPGNADEMDTTKQEMGQAGAYLVQRFAKEHDVVAVAGGSTVAAVAERMTPSSIFRSLTFVPARGGLGEAVELEANYIVSHMANHTGGNYSLMHLPDQLSEDAYEVIAKEPHVEKGLKKIRSANMVIHGVGEAEAMATRRNLTPAHKEALLLAGAVGEAFGYYVDVSGKVVFRSRTIGLQIEDLQRMDTVIAVAGGNSKAAAIGAICASMGTDMLVTDEAAARLIVDHHKQHS
ncbi:sugar-binding transcriptional regulator [Mechercharimyces sp. CAU 1602]|uniref:sugar-binding transcriptional regulator n=1 Tax=Mechercharimyces sp. CAU 1602 TaxID=2973933 RepID=UPI00216110C3|nr:sugar-binding domain-containing protein [Mechercharimyces sp. CAU 1602]MCS1352194.1 hypothetical protein [Mechercharimyces sp. CAU 1602]